MSIDIDHPNETLIPGSGVLGVTSVVNAATGYRVSGAATAGNYLRGNGTNFVSSAIQAGDLTGLVVSSLTGTANQIIASASTGAVTLSLGGPHNFTTQTSHGVLLGQGTSAIAATAAMTDGQLLVGQSSADPLPKTISGAFTLSAAGVASVSVINHSALTGLTTGDDHTQYALLAGRSGGQTYIGGTAASNILTLQSTSNATRGNIVLDGLDLTFTSSMRARMASQNRFRYLNILAKATNSSATTITTSTITIMNWDTNTYDTDSVHSTSSNTSRFTVAIAGKYIIECNLRYDTPASSTGSCHVGWRLNGSGASDKNIAAIPISSTANLLMVNAAVPVSLAAGDYVEFWAFQNNGGNMTVSTADSFGAITYIGE